MQVNGQKEGGRGYWHKLISNSTIQLKIFLKLKHKKYLPDES